MKFGDFSDKKLKVLNYQGGCHKCPRGLKDFVPAEKNEKGNRVILVGEAPGAKEVEEGRPFVGQTGQRLRSALEKVGVTNYDITNSIHCRPPNNRDPYKTEIACCANQYVLKEVEGYDIVVLVGRVPTSVFFPNEKKFKNLRGHFIYHPDFPGSVFYPIYHPGYITRNQSPEVIEEWEKSLKKIKTFLDEGNNPQWNIVTGDDPGFLDKLDDVLSNKHISYDIETNKLESYHDDAEIRSFAIGSSSKEALFAHQGQDVFQEAMNRISKVMEDPDKVFIAFNAGFDLEYQERLYGAFPKCQILDPQSIYYLAEEEMMPSQKYLTAEYLGGYQYLIINPDSTDDTELLTLYNTEDIVRCGQLAKLGLKKLNRKQKDLVRRVSSPSSLALRRLQTNGFHFDMELAKDTRQKIQEEKEKLCEMWKEYDPKFNPDKHLDGDGLIWYLYEHRNLPILRHTKKDKKPSTDKYVLKDLERQTEEKFLPWLSRIKMLDKLDSTFIKPYVNGKYIDSRDGKVHASFFNTTTKTGRSSSRNPNLQQLVRDDTVEKTEVEGISYNLVGRRLFKPEEGHVLVEADLSQIELRIIMSLAGDETGLGVYNEHGDIHEKTGRMIAQTQDREYTKLDRTYAKPVNFGLGFCHENRWKTLQKNAWQQYNIKLSDKEAKDFADTYFNTYTSVHDWQFNVVQELRANAGYVESVMGHKVHYPNYNSEDEQKRLAAEREAINMKVQSLAGYITLYLLYLAQQGIRENGLYGSGVRTISSVHDSIYFTVPKNIDIVYNLMYLMDRCVGKTYRWIKPWFHTPLVMDFAIGSNQSDMQEVEGDGHVDRILKTI